jgi:hypothetical protein
MNFQEDFQYLLKILTEKQENTVRNEDIPRIRKALMNVMNSFITDFDKSILKKIFIYSLKSYLIF